MRVYVVLGESGVYSGWTTWIESVHTTMQGAVDSIERMVFERDYDLGDGEPMAPWDYDDSNRITVFQHAVRRGNVWLEPDDPYMGDESSWHIEEWEVDEP